MAVLAASQFTLKFGEGSADRVGFYAVNNATTGDTFDVAGVFSRVKLTAFVCITAQGASTGAVAGTVITVPTGYANDSAWVTVWGDAGPTKVVDALG